MEKGVAREPAEALRALNATLAAIRHRGNARVWLVGSSTTQKTIAEDLDRTLASLDPSAVLPATPSSRRRLLEGVRSRGEKDDSPFVALVNPSTGSISLVHTAPSPGFDETQTDALVDYLAFNVFSGGGTHSLSRGIWDQALAYSGYVTAWPDTRRKELYVDRSADLPALLRFVDAEVRRVSVDDGLVDHAIASAFFSRGAYAFEVRARSVAADLVDGKAPDRVRAFHARLLALRQRPHLAEELLTRAIPTMSALIPSLAAGSPLPSGALYFTVGPETRLTDYEREMQHALGADVKVVRLWPRDFWDPRSTSARPTSRPNDGATTGAR